MRCKVTDQQVAARALRSLIPAIVPAIVPVSPRRARQGSDR